MLQYCRESLKERPSRRVPLIPLRDGDEVVVNLVLGELPEDAILRADDAHLNLGGLEVLAEHVLQRGDPQAHSLSQGQGLGALAQVRLHLLLQPVGALYLLCARARGVITRVVTRWINLKIESNRIESNRQSAVVDSDKVCTRPWPLVCPSKGEGILPCRAWASCRPHRRRLFR